MELLICRGSATTMTRWCERQWVRRAYFIIKRYFCAYNILQSLNCLLSRYQFLNVKYFSHPTTRLTKTFLLTIQKVDQNIIYPSVKCSVRAIVVPQQDRTHARAHTHMYIWKGKEKDISTWNVQIGSFSSLSGNNGNDKLIRDKSSFGLSSFFWFPSYQNT
jgi:hypothetical protein